MATTKPRITITLEQRQYDVIKSISDSTGQAMSGVITELLESSMPVFERMAVTFQMLAKAKDLQRSNMLKTQEEVQAAFEPLMMEAMGQFDMFMGQLEEGVEELGKARPIGRALSKASTANRSPSTNRGVTTTPLIPSRASRSKVSKGKIPVKKIQKAAGKKS